MTPTSVEVQDLLQRGVTVPVVLTLTSPKALPESATVQGWTVAQPGVLLADPEGLTLRRAGDNLHVLRGERDLWRRNGEHSWHFLPGQQAPLRYNEPGILAPRALGIFFSQRDLGEVFPLHLLRNDDIAAGSTAGRDTWVLTIPVPHSPTDPAQPVLLEVDQEHGVVLATETARQRVAAAFVEFPDSLPDPTWEGLFDRPPNLEVLDEPAPVPAEIPHHLAALPPQSEDPRKLRVYIYESSLEGAFPRYRVGESTRMPLGFDTTVSPLPGLTTTRRGLVRNLGEPPIPDTDGTPHWSIMLTGDGWQALAHVFPPEEGETVLTGWFHYSAYGESTVPTDLVVDRIFAGIGAWDSRELLWQELSDTRESFADGGWGIRDVVLDVSLDGAVPPPLPTRKAILHNPVLSGARLWLRDLRLPVLRCWDTVSGRYLGQVLVPAPMTDTYPVLDLVADPALGAVATDGRHGWVPDITQQLAVEAPGWNPPSPHGEVSEEPDVPESWEYLYPLGEGLFAMDTARTGTQRCAVGRREADGRITLADVGTDNAAYPVLRVGGHYLVRTVRTEMNFDDDLQLVSARVTEPNEPRWHATGSVAHRSVGSQLQLLHLATGGKLPALAIPEGASAQVLAAAGGQVTVLLRSLGYGGLRPLAVSRLVDGTWDTTSLAEAPAELYSAN